MTRSFFICLLILLGLPSLSLGEQPIDVLQRNINRGIAILKDPQYLDVNKKTAQQEALCDLAWQLFDFEEYSRRILAYRWRSFSPTQRRQFIDVFAQFLCKYYLTRLQEGYADEKVIYLGQRLINDSKASVRVSVLWKGLEVPVEVRMLNRNDTWRVYDIIVLGISAVQYYRAQFQELLLRVSPGQVITLIENRIKMEEENAATNNREDN
ncbi:MAG: ABC transporter substrate-binding protein [Deltaproteobacteria bacterium]|nr:ABC transporter substrate-binding protein [Deltaproteobacteria bacterium]